MEDFPRVGAVSLEQQGWFNAHMRFRFGPRDEDMTDGWGNLGLNAFVVVDPGDRNKFKHPLAPGARFRLRVDIDDLRRNLDEAHQEFIYEPGSPNVAQYVICGATWAHWLGLIDVGPVMVRRGALVPGERPEEEPVPAM